MLGVSQIIHVHVLHAKYQPFPKRQISDSFKLKEFADDNFEFVENGKNGQKTAWERQKLLVTSNFSFSCSVFKSLVLQTRNDPFSNKPWFLRVCSTSLLKTLQEKEKLLVTSNFSFSRNVFYPFGELSAIFVQF